METREQPTLFEQEEANTTSQTNEPKYSFEYFCNKILIIKETIDLTDEQYFKHTIDKDIHLKKIKEILIEADILLDEIYKHIHEHEDNKFSFVILNETIERLLRHIEYEEENISTTEIAN